MPFDNQRDQTSLFTDQSWVTSILPHSVLTTLAFPVEQLHPAAPPLVPPDPERLTSYPAGGASPHESWLAFQRTRYRYRSPANNPIFPIALAERVPITANYDLRWAAGYMPVLLPILGHVAANRVRFAWQRVRGKFDKFAAYRQIFSGVVSPRCDLPIPAPVTDYEHDAAFARQRLDGPNPLQIFRITDPAWPKDHLPTYTAADFNRTTGHDLAAELAAGNLYACDYILLKQSLIPAAERDTRWRAAYLPAPIVLFWYHPGKLPGSDLVPVAIQLDQKDAYAWDQPDYSKPAQKLPPALVTPQSGADPWSLAKTIVQCADQNMQVNSTHVGRTHWMLEPFALAIPRQLPPDHPLYLLFEPHIRFTLAVNDTTIPLITEQGKIFSAIYAGTLVETRQIMINTYETWTYRQLEVEADLKQRGMDTYPGHYPYREDLRRIWQAIQRFVDRYVRIYYSEDAAVVRDRYLQAFINELLTEDEGNMRGLLAGSALTTVDELIAIVAQFVAIAGPQHAAVHYPQLEYFTFIPASPGAAYQPPPLPGQSVTSDRTLATLPPENHAIVQFQTDQIGNYRYDRFGDYSRYNLGRSTHAPVKAAIAAFQAELRTIEAEIERDNNDPRKRVRPYVYLLPSNIPNSINI